MIDLSVIERLLYEEESTVLDFKQTQYPFDGASDDTRGEIIKDILAYANAWRRADAYILTGVEDVKGGKGVVRGVAQHLDDAKLQQFVNSKTQRPVVFSYYAVCLEGKQIGVIHIPVQNRPIFLVRDFGRLRKNTVYVRRSSSTDEADPDEVARMGEESAAAATLEPVIDVNFGDARRRSLLGHAASLSTSNVVLPPAETIPDYPIRRSSGPFELTITDTFLKNRDYYRQLAQYNATVRSVRPIWLVATNTGPVVGSDVRVEIEIPDAPKSLVLMDQYEFPDKPITDISLSAGPITAVNADVEVRPVPEGWFIEANFGKLQPKATAWSQYPLYVGSDQSRSIELVAHVFADNLEVPTVVTLSINIQVAKVTLTLERLLGE